MQYTYLLTSQLESQRLFHEQRIQQFEAQALKAAADGSSGMKTVLARCNQLEEELRREEKETVHNGKRANQVIKYNITLTLSVIQA